MKVLDCENEDRIYESLERILGITRPQLERVFESFDLESSCETYRDQSPEALVFLEARKVATLPECDYDQTYWFHLTRTTPGARFLNGILPLGQSLDLIWDFLTSLSVSGGVSRDKCQALRREMESGEASFSSPQANHYARLYRNKAASHTHWGPFAILVRDHAFEMRETGSHDYLSTPEIVEDICRCFSERYEFDLLKAFSKQAAPCIVKFVEDKRRLDCVEAAVYHLFNRVRGFSCSSNCSTCYNGEGIPVTHEKILAIDCPGGCAAEIAGDAWDRA